MPGKPWDPKKIGPRGTATPSSYEDLRDPALGERVRRCLTCGIPGKLLDFALLLAGRPAGRYRLCERCWMAANPPDPMATDPLRVDEAA